MKAEVRPVDHTGIKIPGPVSETAGWCVEADGETLKGGNVRPICCDSPPSVLI